jgi:UDP-N-acetylmuramoyl-tripeptide--D-alanyl-D-alanine ligase
MPLLDPGDLADWSGGRWTTAPQVPLNGVCSDTRALKEGSLFVALSGPRFDAHSFVADALAKGAAAAMVRADRVGSLPVPHPLLAVEDPHRALQNVAAGYRRKLAPEIVAVTGSVGKTTVKELTACLLAASQPTARTRGNWNNDIGLPLSLLEMDPSTRFGVFEVGTSHPGEIAALCQILRPDWGILTNIGPVHIEFFGDQESIAREKSALLAALPDQGCAVLDLDSPFFDLFRQRTRARLVTVSMEREADYRCVSREGMASTVSILDRKRNSTGVLHVPLPGRHNALNLLMAVAVAREHNLPWDRIETALRDYRSPPMRWEREAIAGRAVINDAYNANPVSMRAALNAFAEEPFAGRRWLVLGGMLELGPHETPEHLELGRFAAQGDWAGVIVLGPLGSLVADGLESAGFDSSRVMRCSLHAEAADLLAHRTQPGDAVLLKASRGMKLEMVKEHFKQHSAGRNGHAVHQGQE